MAKTVLILGGVRSGKSHFALRLARQIGGDAVLFVATAEAHDDEMRERIAAHQRFRPHQWRLSEAPTQVGKAIAESLGDRRVVLLDCLTLLASNLLCAETSETTAEARMKAEIREILEACSGRDTTLIIVSGEVGMGIVPESPLGRRFRDLLGRANQQISATATATYLLVAGQAVELKALSQSVDQAARAILDAR